MFEPRKRKITANEYSAATKMPIDSFWEDEDYIVLNRPETKLKFLISRKAYTSASHDTKSQYKMLRNRYFDIAKIRYRLPYIPGNEKSNIMLGQYFFSEQGPSFLLTEPKNATHVLFLDGASSPFYYKDKVHNVTAYTFEDDEYQVYPLEEVFQWLSKFMWSASSQQLAGEKDRFLKRCQVKFYGNLEQFYAQG